MQRAPSPLRFCAQSCLGQTATRTSTTDRMNRLDRTKYEESTWPRHNMNWGISGDRTLRFVRRLRLRDIVPFVEQPRSLWNEPNSRNDSVSLAYLQNSPIRQSLYLIRPDSLRVQFFTSFDQRKRRARFTYGAEEYDLAVTDPAAPGRYSARYPDWPDKREHSITGTSYLCISLAHAAFRGRHYKIVATIFDPSHM
jgi:hypothetical protein